MRRWNRRLATLTSLLRDNPLRSRLGRRLLGWLLLFSLLPIATTNLVGYVASQAILERLTKQNLAALADAEAQHVRDQVDGLLKSLHLVAAGNRFLASGVARAAGGGGGPMAIVADRPALETYLGRKLAELSEFDALFLQRLDGSIAAATGPIDPDVELLAAFPTDTIGIESLEGAMRHGRPRFRLSVPIESADGELVGYLAAVMGPEGRGELLAIPPHVAGAVESFIVDRDGRVLFVSHVHGQPDYGLPFASPLLARRPGAFARYTDREGTEVLGTSVAIAGLPWRYVAEFPIPAVFGPLRYLRRISLLLGVGFTGLLVVGAWLVAGGILAPVRRLVTATRQLGSGDLSVRVPAEGRDEIGQLGSTFNEMAGELESARTHLEELHRREMERAGRLATVGELASGVAHEIKNPVVGISNGLDLVRRRIGRDEALEPILEEMAHQLARIEGAIRDLLAFARPAEPRFERADVNRIVERAHRLVEPAGEKARVDVRLRLDARRPMLNVDPGLLQQAVVNLAMNAVQATPTGGHVVLSTRLVERDGEVRIEVTDDGRGIAEDRREEIYKPFFTTRPTGSGLGLTITRDVVNRHSGRLELESRVGEGSTFRIVLPAGGQERTA